MYSFMYTGGRWVHAHLYAHGAQRITLDVISQRSARFVLSCCLVCWMAGLNWDWISCWSEICQIGWSTIWTLSLRDQLPSKLVLKVYAIIPWCFYVGFGGSNLCSWACRTSPLLTEPSPQNPIFLFSDYPSFRNEHKREDSDQGGY